MSIELDPRLLEFRGTPFHVFASINDEHPSQIDFIRIVRLSDQSEIDLGARQKESVDTLYWDTLRAKAWAVAEAQASDLEWDIGDDQVIDHADILDNDS